MNKDWLDSVVLITSSNPETRDFGTGFAIHCEGQITYILTCAHVVEAVGGSATVKVNDIQPTVAALGSASGIDLAVLRVMGLDKIPLSLGISCQKGKAFTAAGFQWFNNNKEYLYRPLNGILGEQVQVGADLAKFVKAWDLKITDDYQLQPGNSGSPVVDVASNTVIGVVRTRQGDGQKGLAISIEALAKIWPEMPPSIISKDPQTSTTTINDKGEPSLFSVIEELKELLPVVPSANFEMQKLFEKLQTIILHANLPETVLEESYYKCVPWNLLHGDAWIYPKGNLLEALQKLNEVPIHQDNIPAILLFAGLLAERTNDPYSTMMRQWVYEEAAQAWGAFDNKTIATACQALATPISHTTASTASTYPSLLITLNPSPTHPSSYFVEAWLHCGQQANLVHLPLTDEASISQKQYTPRTISQYIDYILKEMKKCAEYSKLSDEAKGKLCIEFFLPYYQLDMEVDNWRFDEGRDRVGRGVRLVVRPLEHINDRGLSGAPIDEVLWRKKWEKVQNSLQETTLCWIHDCGEFENKQAYNYVNLKKKLDDEKIICLLAPFALSKLKLNKKEFLEAIIKTGTPIALWPRKLSADSTKEIQKVFESLQKTYPDCIFKLLEIVFQKRRDSENVTKDLYHLGRHLTFLWDNPNRLPPSSHSLQLRQP